MDETRQLRLWRRAGGLPRVAVALVLPLCTAVLAGWVLQGEDVLSPPGVPPMVPASATCLMLAAVATTWLLRGSPTRHWLAGIAAALVTATGLFTLLSYVWRPVGVELSGMLSGRRMSPHTASALTLLGLSLLTVDRRGRWGTARSQLLALAAMLMPLTVLLGYAFAEHRIYRLGGGNIGAAPHNAAAQLLLALGILFLRPDQGPVATVTSVAAGGVMARRLLFAGLLPLVVGVLVDLGARRGFVEARLAWPLFAMAMMLALTTVVWRAAGESNRLHQEQVRAWKQAGEEAAQQRRLAVENARLARAAEAAAREREDVLAIVSHDLKNPLATVRLSAAVLQQKLLRLPGGEGLAGRVAAMDRAAVHMLGLITELLDAARLDAGQPLAVKPRPEPVGELLGEALALVEPQATRAGLRLEQHLTPGLMALCDRERILQVLANLLGNAVKFTPAGGTVTVEARSEAGEVRVAVRDTGPGIPEHEQPRLFVRYWQARGTAHRGSGLGLYIARGLVEAHGGRLWVESVPGAGSTFTFTLPLPPGRRLAHPTLDSSGAEV